MVQKKNRRPQRRASRLKQHRPSPERKKLLQPPLRQLPMTDMRWPQDHVPNFLWAGGLVVDNPDDGLQRMANVLDAMHQFLKDRGADLSPKGILLDGSLTSFESVPEELRADLLDYTRGRGLAHAACPEGFAHAIRMYPGAPGEWLSNLCAGRDLHIDPEAAQRYLAPVIAATLSGRSPASTAIKASVFRQYLVYDRLRFHESAAPPEALFKYPRDVNDDERSLVGAYVRANYGALQAADEEGREAREGWAKRFWRANWSLYPCLQRGETRYAEPPKETDDMPMPEAEEPPDAAEFDRQLREVWDEFHRVAHTADPDLYEPDRHEVLTGLTAHGLRIAVAVGIHPGLWVGEFSAALLRIISEILIVLAWLRTPAGDDPEIYVRFKDFGRGRLKLMKLHAEEFADTAEGKDILRELIEQLDDEVNEDVMEEFQDISIEGTFAGMDLRKMAQAAGVEWPYKLSFAPMSSVTHSEWPILARYSLRRCANPLHRFHRLPRPDLSPALMPVGGQTAVLMAEQLLEAYRSLVVPVRYEEPARERDEAGGGPSYRHV